MVTVPPSSSLMTETVTAQGGADTYRALAFTVTLYPLSVFASVGDSKFGVERKVSTPPRRDPEVVWRPHLRETTKLHSRPSSS